MAATATAKVKARPTVEAVHSSGKKIVAQLGWKRLRPVRLHRDQVAFRNRLIACTPFTLRINDASFALSLPQRDTPREDAWALSVRLRGGGVVLTAALSRGLLEILLEDLAPVDAVLAFPPHLRTAAVAAALDAALTPLERRLRTRLALLDVNTTLPPPGAEAVTLRVCEADSGARQGHLRLAVDDGAARLLEPLLRAQPPVATFAHPRLAVPLTVALPAMCLTVAELRSLRRGDVLRPGVRHDAALFPIRIGAGLHAEAAIHEDRCEIKEIAMSTEKRKSVNRAPDTTVEAGALELDLSFDIGRTQISISELSALQPGYVFELPKGTTAKGVLIRANDTPIGRGELVAIGEELGVRLLEIFDGDDRARQ